MLYTQILNSTKSKLNLYFNFENKIIFYTSTILWQFSQLTSHQSKGLRGSIANAVFPKLGGCQISLFVICCMYPSFRSEFNTFVIFCKLTQIIFSVLYLITVVVRTVVLKLSRLLLFVLPNLL